MLANYHTHTVRCKHASGTEREYIEQAIQRGFLELGFSDHVPQPYPEWFTSGIRMDMSELEDYTSTLYRLKEEYKKDIKILVGYEVEYSRRFFPTLLDKLREYPYDYMIMGQHYVPNEVEGFYTGSKTPDEERLLEYVDLVIEGMNTGHFAYLAHPDLMYFSGPDEIYQKHMKKLVQASIDMDFPLEVNFAGFVWQRHYPSDRFFSLASSMGAKFIIGCDAHDPDFIRHPEELDAFEAFLSRNNIDYGDNLLNIDRETGEQQ